MLSIRASFFFFAKNYICAEPSFLCWAVCERFVWVCENDETRASVCVWVWAEEFFLFCSWTCAFSIRRQSVPVFLNESARASHQKASKEQRVKIKSSNSHQVNPKRWKATTCVLRKKGCWFIHDACQDCIALILTRIIYYTKGVWLGWSKKV